MKKILSGFLAIMMVLCCVSALAQSDEPGVYSVDIPDGDAFGYAQLGFQFLVPAGFVQTAVADSDKELGAFDMFVNEETGCMIQLRLTQVEEGYDFEAYYNSLATNEDVLGSELSVINDVYWICYSTSANQVIGVTTLDSTMVLTVIGATTKNAEFVTAFQKVLGSVVPYTEE